MPKFFLVFLIILLAGSTCLAQQEPINDQTKLPGHPRILMLQGEEEAIKRTIAADPTWSGMNQAIINEGDNIIVLAPVERIKIGRRLLDKSREALRRLFILSYAYRLTGKLKYVERAEKEMLAIAAFTDWNPTHFLDVGEMTMAMAIGYDWLFNQLPASSKNIIKQAIITKGIEPSFDNKYNSWLKAEHNWNQVCNAGMTYGALAIYEDEPELAKKVINRALGSIVLAMKDYGPDGIYPEGYGYWGYGTSFNVMFNSAMEKAFGTDFGLNSKPGFLNTARFLENMTGPSGSPFNYSDSGPGGGLQPAMFWFANKLNDPSVLWVEKRRLMENDLKSHVKNRLIPALMIWNGSMSLKAITAPKYGTWAGKGKNPIAMMRTSWTDPNAIYVAAKGGSVSINHAHMDIGSFIMEANGVRWAMDFGAQEYESLESRGMSIFGRTQDAQRWTVFRYINQVHNTLTINDQHQRVTGSAPLLSYSNKPAFKNAVFDISEVYKGAIAKAQRGVGIVDNKYVVVRDELQTLPQQTTIRWTMLTPAAVKITGKNTAELTKDGKVLILEVKEPGNIIMKTWSTDPPHDYDAPNPGTTLVGFELQQPGNTKTALTVTLTPMGTVIKTPLKKQPLQNWSK